jgi:acyl-CoA reductase-like NAD-dependent aldehyde dehydrogenase
MTPADGSVLAEVSDGDEGDALDALDAAVAVQDDWRRTAPRERSEILRRAFEPSSQRTDEFATLMSLEMGKPSPRRAVRSRTPRSSSAGSPRRPCASTAGTGGCPTAPPDC